MISRLVLAVAVGVLAALNLGTGTAVASPMMVAHRGAVISTIDENTWTAFDYAIKNGAQTLKTDVRWSKPSGANPYGVPVLHHDANLKRVTGCDRLVADTYYSTMRDQCLGLKHGGRVTTLDSLLNMASSNSRQVIVDLKTTLTDGQANLLWSKVKQYPGVEVVVFSNMKTSLDKIKKRDAADSSRRLRYGYECSGLVPSLATVRSYGTRLHIRWTDITKEQVAYFQANGISVYGWIANDDVERRGMLAKGFNGIIDDDVKALSNLLAT